MERTNSFGYWLRRRRKALDLTQVELAQRVSCSLELIQKIEADARRPSRQLAEKLAGCLGIAGDERAAFVQAARAERAVDQLSLPSQPIEQPVAALPQGTITFLFTDIEGSSRLWEQYPRAMPAALARHDALLNEIVTAHGGVVFKTVGDSVLAAFGQAPDALAAALAGHRAISTEAWELPEPPRVRMALHTGAAEARAGDYFGPALNRAARLLSAGHGGQILLSLATEQLVREQLPPDAGLRELGTHRLKDLSLPEQIFQLAAPDLPATFPALNTLDARRTNLPAQPTALLGREQEVATVATLLRNANNRLITLTGPGGVGKTRLSVQVAAELAVQDSPPLLPQRERGPGGEGQFLDGVYFVDLAPIRDSSLVTSAIAATLGVRESGGQPLLATLKDYLHNKRMLLLLDNFEQVLDAAPLVADLLATASQLKLLVTSREILHLRGEKEVAVQPLALPDRAHLPPFDQLSQYAAVALFIQRAVDAPFDFQVTNATAPAVAEICVQLDGLPLAIELAAARLKLFPPEALLARLSSRLALLSGGPRDLPARQQTIRNTIAWSYDLLSDVEQTLFRRLGVFVGGCTIEAAEAVCNTGRDLMIDVVDGVAALLDQSMLRQERGDNGEPRLLMLETIREYALERLEMSGETETMRQQHAAYYLALAETAETQLRGAQQQVWLTRLESEHDNFRAVLAWSQAAGGDAEEGLRLASVLRVFWFVRGYLSEGRDWFTRTLANSNTVTVAVRAKALSQAGWLAWNHGDNRVAQALFEEGLSLSQTIRDTSLIADTLSGLGMLAWDRGDLERASALLEESLALYEQLGDSINRVWPLNHLGHLDRARGDHERARVRLKESLEIFQQMGDKLGSAFALWGLADLARTQGDDSHAATYYDETLSLLRELGHTAGIAGVLHNQAYLARHAGDLRQASALLVESLALSRDLNLKSQIAYDLAGLGGVAVAQSQPESATRLLGVAAALLYAAGEHMSPPEQAEFDRDIAAARDQLGEDAFAAAWAAGQAMTLEEAIAEALSRPGDDADERTVLLIR